MKFQSQDLINHQAASDQWFNEWVETMAEDFEQVELDEFILMD
jgi:hypothetical protein